MKRVNSGWWIEIAGHWSLGLGGSVIEDENNIVPGTPAKPLKPPLNLVPTKHMTNDQ
jgi:hypothetical protein